MSSISSVRPTTPMIPATSSFERTGSSRNVPANTAEAIDMFVRTSSDPWTNTPITDAIIANIESPAKPGSERIALALLTPILVPITVALDVVLWPFIKMGQVSNWVKSKFS